MASSGDLFVKIFAAVMLLAMGLLGLAMTVCGVMFVGTGSGVAPIAVVAILIGLLLIVGAVKLSTIGIRPPERSGDDPPSDRAP